MPTLDLRLLLDEIFSPRNFIAQLVWDKTRKNDAKLFSVGHEYLIVYAKSLQCLKDRKTVWREQKPGAREISEKWQELGEEHGNGYDIIQEKLRAWYRSLPQSHPAKKLSRYNLLVMPSVLQKQAQVSVRLLRKIFEGSKAFPNPKDHEVIMRLVRYVTGPDDLILDSFAGSGTTGHAVLQLRERHPELP